MQRRRGIVVELPTLRAPKAGLIRPRSFTEGELAQVKLDLPEAKRWVLVPSRIAKEWESVGVAYLPQSVVIGVARVNADVLRSQSDLVDVRIKFSKTEQKSFAVPVQLARKWYAHALRFERVKKEYDNYFQGVN